jgi:pimeloyl-ACP methyl ester carboxylesterase
MRRLYAAFALAAISGMPSAWSADGVERGTLLVPESRSRPTGRSIRIPYVRMRSTAAEPAAPIFVLAGGPGDSLLESFDDAGAEAYRAQREIADVVIFDQRGAGQSSPSLECPDGLGMSLTEAAAPEAYVAAMRRAAAACRAHFEREGIDLTAYSTFENAADVDALRRSLGYRTITLMGGSYGSHLALALVRDHREIVSHVILWGIEGPDHTYDMPSEVAAAYERIAAEVGRLPDFAARLPPGGVLEALRLAEKRLEKNPATVTVERNGGSEAVTLGRFDLQAVVPSGALNRDNLAWPARILEIYEGDYRRLAHDTFETRRHHPDAMYFMMDCASGVSAERRERLRCHPAERRAATLLGDLNRDYEACDAWHAPDLGARFRSDVITDVPAILFAGTWDFATPLENARRVARGFRNGKLVVVGRGTHLTLKDLAKLWPPFWQAVGRFLRESRSEFPESIELPEATFILAKPAAR